MTNKGKTKEWRRQLYLHYWGYGKHSYLCNRYIYFVLYKFCRSHFDEIRKYGATTKELFGKWLACCMYAICELSVARSVCFSCVTLLHFIVWRIVQIISFPETGSFICLLYFTNVVQLLCSLSGWLHLNCSSVGTGFLN